jgi:hypothetical protein
LLHTIAHGIWTAAEAPAAFSLGWDGQNYLLNDGSGDLAAVTFTPDYTVAAFFDLHSERSPWRAAPHLPFGENYRADDYFAGAPAAVWELAQRETLQYLLDDYDGSVQSIITAACWSDGEMMTAREPWSAVCQHADHLLVALALPLDEAIDASIEQYELSDEHGELCVSCSHAG